MKNKILVLGSDLGTIDIVNEAHKMGLYVIVSDLMETSPTKEAADEKWLISTNDFNTLEVKCKELNIKGLLYGVSEFNAGCAHTLAKRLGLPVICENEDGWGIGRNKSEFKKKCLEVGAPVATNYFLDDDLRREDLDKIVYPVVIKPVDKSGNRGMSYCFDEADVINAYKAAREISDNPVIICERMLKGPEWVANYVLTNGEARLIYFGRELHQTGERANLYSMIVTSPNGLRQWSEEVNQKVIDVFKHAGFENGIAWVELMLDEDGQFYLIEPGYRFSSEASYSLYEKVSGFNSVRWMIEDAIGIKHSVADLPENLNEVHEDCVAGYHLFSKSGGRITSIEGLDEISEIADISIDLPKRMGGIVAPNSLMGLIKFYGINIYELKEKLELINKKFFVRDENGNNMFIKYTDYDILVKDYEAGREQFQN